MADYAGAGTGTGALFFRYEVQPVDQDDNGIAVAENGLSLNGGTIAAADDSTSAALAHAAVASTHRVDMDLVLVEITSDSGDKPRRTRGE